MNARCELDYGHAGQHTATIGHGHVEHWDGDTFDTTPADYEAKRVKSKVEACKACIAKAEADIRSWRSEIAELTGAATYTSYARTGHVVEASSDYVTSEISNTSGVEGATVGMLIDSLYALARTARELVDTDNVHVAIATRARLSKQIKAVGL
jgi:hypothetical protein